MYVAGHKRADRKTGLAAGRSPGMAFSTSTWTSSSAEPTRSISRDARREECTIWTAIAPDAVFTVRSYGDTGSLYGPGWPALPVV